MEIVANAEGKFNRLERIAVKIFVLRCLIDF